MFCSGEEVTTRLELACALRTDDPGTQHSRANDVSRSVPPSLSDFTVRQVLWSDDADGDGRVGILCNDRRATAASNNDTH